MCSIDEEDESAARVDIVDGEQQPMEYSYPSNPLVRFCDLPGYGTPTNPDLESYWNKFELEEFDIFIIFITSRIMGLDLAILRKIKSINKSLFIVRPKIDMEFTQNRKKLIEEELLLSKIKNYILRYTKEMSCTEEDIFLISNYEPYKWEFFRLVQAIMKAMPVPEIGK